MRADKWRERTSGQILSVRKRVFVRLSAADRRTNVIWAERTRTVRAATLLMNNNWKLLQKLFEIFGSQKKAPDWPKIAEFNNKLQSMYPFRKYSFRKISEWRKPFAKRARWPPFSQRIFENGKFLKCFCSIFATNLIIQSYFTTYDEDK